MALGQGVSFHASHIRHNSFAPDRRQSRKLRRSSISCHQPERREDLSVRFVLSIISHYFTSRQLREATVICMVAPCLRRSGNQQASSTIPLQFRHCFIRPSTSAIFTRTPLSHRLLNNFPSLAVTRHPSMEQHTIHQMHHTILLS